MKRDFTSRIAIKQCGIFSASLITLAWCLLFPPFIRAQSTDVSDLQARINSIQQQKDALLQKSETDYRAALQRYQEQRAEIDRQIAEIRKDLQYHATGCDYQTAIRQGKAGVDGKSHFDHIAEQTKKLQQLAMQMNLMQQPLRKPFDVAEYNRQIGELQQEILRRKLQAAGQSAASVQAAFNNLGQTVNNTISNSRTVPSSVPPDSVNPPNVLDIPASQLDTPSSIALKNANTADRLTTAVTSGKDLAVRVGGVAKAGKNLYDAAQDAVKKDLIVKEKAFKAAINDILDRTKLADGVFAAFGAEASAATRNDHAGMHEAANQAAQSADAYHGNVKKRTNEVVPASKLPEATLQMNAAWKNLMDYFSQNPN